MPDHPDHVLQQVASPRWPGRLQALAAVLRSGADDDARRTREQIWVLLYSALTMCFRSRAGRVYGLIREDLEDLISDKALDLLRRLENGSWDLSRRSPAEIQNFFAAAARNSLINWGKKNTRSVLTSPLDLEAEVHTRERNAAPGCIDNGPAIDLERKGFANALRRCAEKLNPRSRKVWIFKLFGGLSAKEIAVHPEIGLTANGVDVTYHRCRKVLKTCMQESGYEARDMPTGVFVELVDVFLTGPAGADERKVDDEQEP